MRAAQLWASGVSYPKIAEKLRGEGYDGLHPPKPRCGSHQTALNWATKGRTIVEAGENYAQALDRDDGRLMLAHALLNDMAEIQSAFAEDKMTLEKTYETKKWMYPLFLRLIGGFAPTQVTVHSTTGPAPDPAMLEALDATVDPVLAEFERGQEQRAAERRAARDREDEGA